MCVGVYVWVGGCGCVGMEILCGWEARVSLQ